MPACWWLIANSFSTVGSNGESMMREMKLIRKMTVRKSSGPAWGKKAAPPGRSPSGCPTAAPFMSATFAGSSLSLAREWLYSVGEKRLLRLALQINRRRHMVDLNNLKLPFVAFFFRPRLAPIKVEKDSSFGGAVEKHLFI